MIVTRFAPSPTGFLHLGHAFAALTAQRAAEQSQGRFLLRIEDIDIARSRPEYEQAIKDDLRWLGLAFEKPVRRQSEHFADYAAALTTLDEKGLLYPCFCTRKEIAEEIARAEAGIEQALFVERLQRRRVVGEMLGLPAHRFLEREPEPAEIVLDRLFVFGAASANVDVLDPQQEPATALLRRAMRRERRERVAQMQKSSWTWGEAGDNHGSRQI